MASLGFRCITEKGMIFYFLREWLDNIKEADKKYQVQANEWLKQSHTSETMLHNANSLGEVEKHQDEYDYYIRQHKEFQAKVGRFSWVIYIAKPIILYSTCMASVHTLIWWPFLVGSYSIDTILVMLAVAFLNTLLFGLIELIHK